jgi:hypothetical protein
MGPERVLLFLILCVSNNIFAANLKFDQVFSDKGEPRYINYEVTYKKTSGEHHLEVWREGNTRIKRKTDNALELYAIKDKKGPEFNLTVLDLKKKISTQIQRTNLYRIGNFTDWFDLGHGIKHPVAKYELISISEPLSKTKPIFSCKWYLLTQGQTKTEICWSSTYRLPIVMSSSKGDVFWTVTKANLAKIPSSVFEIHDHDFIKNDANRDIEPE